MNFKLEPSYFAGFNLITINQKFPSQVMQTNKKQKNWSVRVCTERERDKETRSAIRFLINSDAFSRYGCIDSQIWNLPNNEKDKRHDPQHILIWLVFWFIWTSTKSSRDTLLANPPKLRAHQEHKSKKKPWNKSSNMSKVVYMREDSHA